MPAVAPSVPVLILDADPVQRRLISDHLRRESGERFRPLAFGSASEARAASAEAGLVIADLESVGGPDGLDALGPNRGLIAISAHGSMATAVLAMRAGAADFIAKPVGAKALIERLEAVMCKQARAPVTAPAERSEADFAGFVGRSSAMLAVYEHIARVASSRAPVLITGESGTGKEVCAEAIHAHGDPRRPFVAINCGALPKDLVESELFGHVRGAFTGALDDRTGAAELAHGGTLFLDEIGELPLAAQVKLLRFVQTGTVQRIGDSTARTVDVRIICATNRELGIEVAAARFRADLLYRLDVLPIRLPALRDRGDDILLLARRFLALYCDEEGMPLARMDADAERAIASGHWPGNVRQLQNVIRRIVVMHRPSLVTGALVATAMADIPEPAAAQVQESIPRSLEGVRPFHEQERNIIETAIAACDGNVSRAAAALQINPSTIYRKRLGWGVPH